MLISLALSFVQKRRRPTLGVQLDDKRKEMLKRHPLSVMLDLKCKGLVALTLFKGSVAPKSSPSCRCRGSGSQTLICPTKDSHFILLCLSLLFCMDFVSFC